MRSIRTLAPLLLLLACGGAEKPAAQPPAKATTPQPAEPPKAAEPAGSRSAPFRVVVTLDERAKAELAKRNEGIIVDVTFSDPNSGGDEQGYRRQEVELGGAGGEAQVGPIDLSPAKPGGGRLTELSINVYSARKSSSDNLLLCPFAGGDVSTLQPTYTVTCSLL